MMEDAVEGWTIASGIATYNSTNGIIGAVQGNNGSIGYISIGQLKNLEGGDEEGVTGVHAVTLDGVVASEDNVLNGTYPIQRNLIVCTLGAPEGSPRGQRQELH